MPRESDPEARRLIAEVLRLESAPWPEVFDAYRAALFALACRCEFTPGQAEFYRWGLRVLHPFLTVDDRRAEYRLDALADVAVHAFTRVLMWNAGLHASTRPNARSMLRLAVLWRAADLIDSMERRHARRRSGAVLSGLRATDSPFTSVWATEMVERLRRDGSPVAEALLLIGQGESIAGAARRAGVSRGRIYRAMAQLRDE